MPVSRLSTVVLVRMVRANLPPTMRAALLRLPPGSAWQPTGDRRDYQMFGLMRRQIGPDVEACLVMHDSNTGRVTAWRTTALGEAVRQALVAEDAVSAEHRAALLRQ